MSNQSTKEQAEQAVGTYYFFKRTGQNIPHKGPRLQLIRTEQCDLERAESIMLDWCDREDNLGAWNSELDAVIRDSEVEYQRGQTSYEHDSRTYWFVLRDEIDEEEAAAALCSRIISSTERDEIHTMHDSLKPTNDDDE